jgi:hypothetical protein
MLPLPRYRTQTEKQTVTDHESDSLRALTAEFGGSWRIWLSDTGRWWAARRTGLTAAESAAGHQPYRHADTPAGLAEQLDADEAGRLGPEPAGATTDPDELAMLAAGFPGFRIWRETVPGRTRYVARGVSLGVRPHTVVTGDLAELRAALTAGPGSGPAACPERQVSRQVGSVPVGVLGGQEGLADP